MLHHMRTLDSSCIFMPVMLYLRLSFSRSLFKRIWRGLPCQLMLLIRQI